MKIVCSEIIKVSPYLLLVDLAHLVPWERFQHFPDAWYLIAAHLTTAKFLKLLHCYITAVSEAYERCYLVSILFVRDAEDANLVHRRMLKQN